ncbi:MAG: TonB-dependent receptor plug domain-containing protein [Balneolaceae bacterium]|nr:TonB-dependent receptor plug domain-containing protein [Balneolaceae bacterium]
MRIYKQNSAFLLLALVAVMIFTGCATTENGNRTSGGASVESAYGRSGVIVDNPNINFTDYLRRIPGISVRGSGPGAYITIRGINTINGNPHPLFVIDGQRVGRNFSSVYNMINMHDVNNIQVLKGAEAATYGIQGAGGVILINTRF